MSARDLNKLAAKRRAEADAIVIDNPHARVAHDQFEFMMEHSRLRGNKGKRCVLLVGPSQAGKSTIIETFAEKHNTEKALSEHRIPVLPVTLAANVTRKGLAQNILEAFEEYGFATASTSGNEILLLQRARTYLREAGVQLLVLDEFHHLIHSESQKLARSVGETVKRMLIKGVCPVVLSGIEAARLPFTTNIQLMQRAEAPIELNPLEVSNPADSELFMRFLTAFLVEIEKRGVIHGAVDLLRNRETPACILEVSQGVLGAACNLIKDAIHIATRAGRDDIIREDLADATDRGFVRQKLYDRNPFVHGYAPLLPRRG